MSDITVPSEELMKQGICYFAVKEDILLNIKKIRSYQLLIKITARVFAVFERKSFSFKEIPISTIDRAEMHWIKQSMHYTKTEFEEGTLNSLRPRITESGTIVLSTRALKGMKYNYNADSFLILTVKDPLAFLWMKYVHEEDHSGVTKTVAKSRRKFWIIRGRRVAQRVQSLCYKCRLLDKKLASQQMSPLPYHRQVVAPVFNVTSIDLFGQIMIKDTVKKRTKMKVWGFVVTCSSTRAVHLDLVDGYSTDAILQTLRKFVNIRGCPSKFISDEGMQLVAAAKDMADLTKDWNWGIAKD